ncbi:DEAD/DEAH box helicase [Frigidibacter oleivorans]|uniref:DEAD/DEAH box helicase n=1 Tax=Frigidibacter oleivorans TaxID=2487129 RepID=UPI000F8D822C|nr:DEAD/DEAH box helicase [Frigidibacter oleivorans]
MDEFVSLPASFQELSNMPLAGYTRADEVIDCEVRLDRVEGRIVAETVGVRVLRGQRRILPTPSPRHAWVADGSVLRPVSRDVPDIFAELLGGDDPADLPYGKAISLLSSTGPLPVFATDRFRQAGKDAAEGLPEVIDIPGLNATLFPYQARGIQWMHRTASRTGGLILADQMGLGKTLQVIALLLLDPPGTASPALIICPTSLIANWVREIEKFAPSLSVLVHRGPHRTGVFRGLQTADVVVTTYDTMVNDVALFSAFEWSWVICDEAQSIKNPDSNRRKEIGTIPRRKSIPMTGTPVENSLLDLWSLVDFAVPGLLGTRSQFEAAYPDTVEAARALNAIADPIILRRRVADVAGDLPERIDIDLPIELDETLVQQYRQVRADTMARYPVAGALVATLQLQLFCAHPWLRLRDPSDGDGEDADLERGEHTPLVTPKIERLVSILREAFENDRKVIVFALFNRLGDLFREACAPGNRVFWDAINGSTPQAERQAIIDRFSEHDGPGCLVLNPKAAGAGLNITAATVVIHFTPVWNPALEDQASARAHRRGQTLPVTVYRLFYEDTVERVMLDRSKWKQELGNEITPVSTRDGEDLRRALSIEPVSR